MTFNLAELFIGWFLTKLNSLVDDFYPNRTLYKMTFNLPELSTGRILSYLYWITYNLIELSTGRLLA